MESTIIRPIISEKSLALASRGWFTFQAALLTTKYQIADAVEKLYKVAVIDVRTIAMHGKMQRSGKRRTLLRKSNWKKALVKLGKGQKIDAFEVSTEAPVPEVKK